MTQSAPAVPPPSTFSASRSPPVRDLVPFHTATVQALNDAETRLLSLLAPGLSYDKRSVRLPTSGHVINTVSVGPTSAPSMVVAHGWGSGLAFFGCNFAALSSQYRVHFVDWLGFGASSRPPFDLGASPEAAEAFFLDAFEEWVDEMSRFDRGFAPFHLVAHSLGAFLSVGLALRSPHCVRNLVLASPVGVPHAPADKGPRPGSSLLRRLMFFVMYALWERNWTPQFVVRSLPEAAGRALVQRIAVPRFPHSDPQTQNALVEYFYQLWCAPGSGEYSLSTVLESGAYAKRPLVEKLPRVSVPVMFLYGDRDWMDSSPAERVCKEMAVPTKVVRISDAGHHVYYDNPQEFARSVLAACEAVKDDALLKA